MEHNIVKCRTLCREEIDELLETGSITPIEAIRDGKWPYIAHGRKFEDDSNRNRRVRS